MATKHYKIILTTANARYSHSSMGLRCLFANLEELQDKTTLIEHTLKSDPEQMVASWTKHNPVIVGAGIYIWNIEIMMKALTLLRKNFPHIKIVIGGPEVSYGVTPQFFNLVDHIVQLEGEKTFYLLCKQLLTSTQVPAKIQRSEVLSTKELKMPYPFYTDWDIKNRKIYVEASRGCAFKCHFCLSSLDNGVRNFDVDLFLGEMELLYKRGVRQFKFVDRTFNLDLKLSTRILLFFLETFLQQDYFLHFEVIPDRLPTQLKQYIKMFKPGILQFEIGIQTFDLEVSRRIGRRQNKEKALSNIDYLMRETNAHLHVDLIIGLPGAGIDVFKKDLNELMTINPHEIQVGMLKNLKGTPLAQHIIPFELKFEANAPYEIQSTKDINFETMNQLRVFQKFWDKFYNSGNFIKTMKYLFSLTNPFDEFFQLALFSFEKTGRTHGIHLDYLCEILFFYLCERKNFSETQATQLILDDFLLRPGRRIPKFFKKLKTDLSINKPKNLNLQFKSLGRQANHQALATS